MLNADSALPPLAVHCQYLKRSINLESHEPLTLCSHPVRDGRDCVGPFLDELPTTCGLWESIPNARAVAPPQPERWQRRRRREGFDLQRYGGGWR